MEFVHLHVHSHYSLLDGACRMDDLAEAATRNGMRALALTDHGNLFGAVKFYLAMKEAGVKPILGYEAYVAPGDRRSKEATGNKDAGFHLTLHCMNETGYRNLLTLASLAYLDGFYRKPRIDKELLARHNEGLIALSGCASSEVNHLLSQSDPEGAAEAAKGYKDIFGDRFYIEVQDNNLPVQKQCLQGAVQIARRLEIPLAATNDIHYMRPQDARAHEVLLCINTGKTISDPTRMQFGTDEFYFKTADQMAERFREAPDAIRNTLEIAERCNLGMDFSQRHYPPFVPPDGQTCEQHLRDLAQKGLRERFGRPTREVRARLDYELGVIEQMGYAAYFLIVWDFVSFARSRGIPTGLRGSGAGALVSYVLRLSDIDPLQYGLLFERFLDPARREAPDLDIDFCENGREEVLRYVKDKYGHESTAQIITFGTLKARLAVRDVGRVLGMPLPEVDKLAKLVPDTLGITLSEALEKEPELGRAYESQPQVRDLMDIAQRIEGLARQAGTHAAGVVIADRDLAHYIPLCKTGEVVMSQFDMNDLEKVGMLKMDFLGLRTLTIVNETLNLVGRREGKRPDLAAVSFDDPDTYALLGRGDTDGVFQLGSQGMQELLRKLQPQNMEDIIAVVAMYRPGPLGSGMVSDYIERRHGRAPIPPQEEGMADILRDTCGVIVYQEQIMRICNRVAAMSLSDALSMIKAISKKKAVIIEKYRAEFIAGAVKNGMTEDRATHVYNLIREFADYGFNRAHSTAYSVLAYHTAYLKAHYPIEFIAAEMNCEMSYIEKLTQHVEDCKRLGVAVLPPSVNESRPEFTVTADGKIRYGLAALRGVGLKAMEAVCAEAAAHGPFTDIEDFCSRVDLSAVNRQAIEALIRSGAMDGLPGNRAQKNAVLEDTIRIGQRLQKDLRRGQKVLFGNAGDRARGPSLPAVEEWPTLDLLRYEKEALGFYMSGHPLLERRDTIEQLRTCCVQDLANQPADSGHVLGGMIASVKRTTSKRGDAMARIEFEDLSGKIEAVVFPNPYQQYGPLLQAGTIVFLRGTVDRSMERLGFRVDEVCPLDEAPGRLSGSVTLRLDRLGLTEETLKDLYAICQRHKGQAAVQLEMVMPDRRRLLLRTGRDITVRAGAEFMGEVDRLLGPSRARLSAAPYDGNGGRRRWGRQWAEKATGE